MPNLSGWGAFAEGIAGGIKGGTESYAQLQIAKINRDEKRALADSEMSIKLISNKNLPLAVRKKAYSVLQKTSKDWNSQLQFPDIPDEMWDNNILQGYMTRLNNIMKDKNIPFDVKMESAIGLEQEAMAAMDIEDVTRVSGAFKPAKERIEEQAFASGIGMLERDEMPKHRGQLLSMSQKGREVMAAKGKRDLGVGTKPSYKIFNGNLYALSGNKMTLMKKGSLREQAYRRAVKDPAWDYAIDDENAQFDLIDKHERMIVNEKKKPIKKPPEKKLSPYKPQLKDLGASDMPDGTIADNPQGVPIITKGGRWVTHIPELEEGFTF